jgi:hypothetical protein
MAPEPSSIGEFLSPTNLLFHLVFGVVMYVVFDTLGLFVAGIVLILGIGRVLVATGDRPRYAVSVLIAALVTVGSGYWLWIAMETEASVIPPSIGLVGGFWILLDTRVSYLQNQDVKRRSSTAEQVSDEDLMVALQYTRIIVTELQSSSEPLTVTQIAERCEIHEKRVRDVIQSLSDDGTIYRVKPTTAENPRYTVDESMLGPSWMYNHLLQTSVKGTKQVFYRLLQPVRYYWKR